ncbi:MAG: exo-beta-N-acetylmuramidase NamZ family protein [Caldivirga sp.]|uniref:exo-beta-N-acetylmuramidase NamZ family protein n=1 Tax=Caldivirga sp. TaxID=2080243 RepID=UPI003D13CC10
MSVVRSGLQVFFDDGYVNDFKGKRVGVVTNHSGYYPGRGHLIDLLIESGVNVEAIFTPEHGLRGLIPAGESYSDESYRGIPVYSLYGPRRKPPVDIIRGLNAVIYSIQDVGVRFYTYISTLFYTIEAAGEAGVKVIVLDNPNPLTGSIIEGPILEPTLRSFIGIWSIPIRYGLTAGELARLFNDEADLKAEVEVIRLDGWRRRMWFDETGLPWVKPSPAIVDLNSALMYPGIGLFEGTNVNEGRGTSKPFRVIGAPWLNNVKLIDEASSLGLRDVELMPIEYKPMGTGVKYNGEECRGVELIVRNRESLRPVKLALTLIHLISRIHPGEFKFLEHNGAYHFDYLVGNRGVRERLMNGNLDEALSIVDDGVSEYVRGIGGYVLYD